MTTGALSPITHPQFQHDADMQEEWDTAAELHAKTMNIIQPHLRPDNCVTVFGRLSLIRDTHLACIRDSHALNKSCLAQLFKLENELRELQEENTELRASARELLNTAGRKKKAKMVDEGPAVETFLQKLEAVADKCSCEIADASLFAPIEPGAGGGAAAAAPLRPKMRRANTLAFESPVVVATLGDTAVPAAPGRKRRGAY